jgi:Phage integrase, N-terminal SAM-like domain
MTDCHRNQRAASAPTCSPKCLPQRRPRRAPHRRACSTDCARPSGYGTIRSAPRMPTPTGRVASSCFTTKRHPQDLGASEVAAFLTYLAVQRNVAASTQNQAKSALLLLYRTGISPCLLRRRALIIFARNKAVTAKEPILSPCWRALNQSFRTSGVRSHSDFWNDMAVPTYCVAVSPPSR